MEDTKTTQYSLYELRIIACETIPGQIQLEERTDIDSLGKSTGGLNIEITNMRTDTANPRQWDGAYAFAREAGFNPGKTIWESDKQPNGTYIGTFRFFR